MALSIGELVGYIDLDTSGAESAVDKVGGLLEGKGGKWAAVLGGVGLGAGVAFGASLSGAMDKEVTLDKLSAKLGLSEGESKRIGGVAGSLYANAYGESLDDVSDAVGAVMQNIDGMATASSKDLEGVTAKVMDLALAFDQDVAMTTAAVGQMMRTGMAKDATEALDIITKGLQSPANKADDLMETMNEYGTQFRKLGLSGKDAMGLLSQGVLAGARDSDIVADALKEFSLKTQEATTQVTKLSDGTQALSTTPLGEAFEAVGVKVLKADGNLAQAALTLQNDLAAGGKKGRAALDTVLDGLQKIEDPAERTRSAVALFGTQAEDMGDALLGLDLDSAADELGKVGGAADKMGKTLNDNASTNLEGFKRRLQTGFVDMIGGKVLPVVTDLTGAMNTGLGPAVSAVGDVVSRVTKFLGEHKTVAATLLGGIVALTAVTATHGAVMSVAAAGGMASWLSSTKLISGATKVWTAVQWAMNAALAANPIGLAVVAIAALVAAVVYVATKTEWGRKMVSKAMDGIRDAAESVGSFFTDKLPKFFSDAWNKAKDWTQDGIDKITGWVGGIPGKFSNKLSSLASTVRELFRDAMQAGKDKVTGIAGSIVDYVAGTPQRFTNNLSNLTGTVRGLFRDAMDAGKEKVTGIGGTIVEWIEGIPGKLLNKLESFKSAGRQLLQGFVDGMKNAAGVIEGIAGNVWNAVRGLLNGAIAKINAALEFTIDLPGPKDLTVNAPNIPMLATGGRATAATLAVIGEGREPESVLPDSVLRGLLERAHAAGAAQAGGNNSRGYNGPLIGKVVAGPNMSADDLAERLWFKTRTRG